MKPGRGALVVLVLAVWMIVAYLVIWGMYGNRDKENPDPATAGEEDTVNKAGTGYARFPASNVEPAFWIEPQAIDLTDARAVARLLELPGNTLIVSCFTGGETLFPIRSGLFRQMPRYQGQDDPFRSLLVRARQKGKRVYAAVDCLHWSRPGMPREQDILESHPSLAERNLEGGCGVPADGKYASPFHPEVLQALRELVHSLAGRYPELDGLLLKCRLPQGSLLGYSDAARVAHIRAKQIDPLDIRLAGSEPEMKLATEWVEARLRQVSTLVKELSSAFKSRNPAGRVAALGYANLYRIPLGSRNTLLEDWLNWAAAGAVDELVLECRWDQPANKQAFASCASLIGKMRKPIRMAPLLLMREGEEEVDPAMAFEVLQGPEVSRVVLQLGREADLDRALKLWPQAGARVPSE